MVRSLFRIFQVTKNIMTSKKQTVLTLFEVTTEKRTHCRQTRVGLSMIYYTICNKLTVQLITIIRRNLMQHIIGALSWTRTSAIRINSPLFYRLDYKGMVAEHELQLGMPKLYRESLHIVSPTVNAVSVSLCISSSIISLTDIQRCRCVLSKFSTSYII